ncbi:hypothetical protein DIE14_25805 [Burkholderia sp. Bp9017]|nr:hypothetical protein DIE14_25805 [Burkholderia sp. Bp9017]RQZ29284.1 hypothetical protein DIE13_26670 [Burkholderia sp. Bp9016]
MSGFLLVGRGEACRDAQGCETSDGIGGTPIWSHDSERTPLPVAHLEMIDKFGGPARVKMKGSAVYVAGVAQCADARVRDA